jgi:hypothetical protein
VGSRTRWSWSRPDILCRRPNEKPNGQYHRDQSGDAAPQDHPVTDPHESRRGAQGGESGYERHKHEDNGNYQEDHVIDSHSSAGVMPYGGLTDGRLRPIPLPENLSKRGLTPRHLKCEAAKPETKRPTPPRPERRHSCHSIGGHSGTQTPRSGDPSMRRRAGRSVDLLRKDPGIRIGLSDCLLHLLTSGLGKSGVLGLPKCKNMHGLGV